LREAFAFGAAPSDLVTVTLGGNEVERHIRQLPRHRRRTGNARRKGHLDRTAERRMNRRCRARDRPLDLPCHLHGDRVRRHALARELQLEVSFPRLAGAISLAAERDARRPPLGKAVAAEFQDFPLADSGGSHPIHLDEGRPARLPACGNAQNEQ
jgi:hypothetical protein